MATKLFRGWIPAMLLLAPAMTCAQFTDQERSNIQKVWTKQVKVETAVSENPAGPWMVRLTPEGSVWLWNYNRARGKSKTPPTQNAPATNDQEATWEKWIDAKVSYDRWIASLDAQKLNDEYWKRPSVPMPMQEDPGPIPADLKTLVGEPPKFANAVRPNVITVKFADDVVKYEDNVDMRPRYAYYRFSEGVMSGGVQMKKLPDGELDSVLKAAGISPSEAKIFKAVSLLEGGFDSVNTYDTGFVSVGFIQFASLKDGAGSLGRTLVEYKTADPKGFENDFRKFGLDVTPEGKLVAYDLTYDQITVGAEANKTIIRDKRLIAVFQRAGRRTPYRVAQLRTAKDQYFPVSDAVNVQTPTGVLTGKVSDIVKTEAGMATLMDRKVNTGSIDIFAEALGIIATEKKITKFEDLAAYEHCIMNAIWYRENYLFESGLTQPAANLEVPQGIMSRYGGRFGRKARLR